MFRCKESDGRGVFIFDGMAMEQVGRSFLTTRKFISETTDRAVPTRKDYETWQDFLRAVAV